MAKLRCGLRTVLLMAMGLSWFPVAWADLNDGLIAHYPFNGNANDASGNGNHGTVNGATLTEDRFGNADSAYKFDGQDDYIDLGQVKTNISSKFSISAEIKAPLDRSAFRVVLSKGLKSRSHFEVYIEKSRTSRYIPGEFRFYSPNLQGTGASGTVIGDFGSGKVVDDDTFHHLVVTYNGSTTTFYLDGFKVYKESTTGVYVDETAQFFIGRQTHTAHGKMSFKGVIDEVRIYNRALSENEIQQLYHLVAIPNPKSIDYVGRNMTYNVSLNGQGNIITVSPGENVSLSMNWKERTKTGNIYCPGCIIQFYYGINGVFSKCFVSRVFWSGSAANGKSATSFKAPTSPGVYYITNRTSLQYQCINGTHSTDHKNAIAAVNVVVTKPQCFWMENSSGKFKWVMADTIYRKTLTKQQCFELDSCSGGLGRSGGGCYKWATSSDAPGIKW